MQTSSGSNNTSTSPDGVSLGDASIEPDLSQELADARSATQLRQDANDSRSSTSLANQQEPIIFSNAEETSRRLPSPRLSGPTNGAREEATSTNDIADEIDSGDIAGDDDDIMEESPSHESSVSFRPDESQLSDGANGIILDPIIAGTEHGIRGGSGDDQAGQARQISSVTAPREAIQELETRVPGEVHVVFPSP